ncbi:hypothetical protein GRS48_02755 [Halorubrum sp. JWXQ-INN 858]|uniref:DUF7573 domain-containing protein n=1 Tax=Halorubrum sp. JWXQ-INN 858 TaxID=2690782 RepID=UPI00135ADCE5|nr:hypothetical protein [Halorubrum sp. JWXQ-INN 858]MWV63748.1 hypothetical protein [Halorubrum sp. JWXQ-INN 858]
MDDDATLDDFAADPDGDASDGDDANADADTDVNADGDTDVNADADTGANTDADTDPDTDPDTDADVDPAVSTSTWTTGGAACDRCGAVVERRWVDDGETVCADCTAW